MSSALRPFALRPMEWLGLCLMLLVTLATRLPFLSHPAADFDEQLYNLIGSRLAEGYWPYLDLWDRKPVGLFGIFALGYWLGGPGVLGYQMLALAACLCGGWQVWRLARRLGDGGSAALASALYPVLMALYGSHSGQSEIFFMPVMMGMAQLLLAAQAAPSLHRARLLANAAMAAGGLALQIKYTVLPQCLFFGVLALWLLHRRGERPVRLALDAALFAALGLLPTLAVAAAYAAHGAWPAYIFANFQSIVLRAAMPMALAWKEQLIFAMPLIVLAAGGLIHSRSLAEAGPWRLALAWLAVAIAGLFMGSTIYPYYYAALAPAVILVAMPMFDRAQSLGTLTLSVALVGLVLVFNPVAHFKASAKERAALSDMTAKLAPHITPGHALFVYDGPLALYGLTQSPLPTRLIYPDHLNNVLEARALPTYPAAEVTRILAGEPGAIVTTKDAITVRNQATEALVNRAISANYHAIGVVEFQDRHLALYARNGTALP